MSPTLKLETSHRLHTTVHKIRVSYDAIKKTAALKIQQTANKFVRMIFGL